MDDKDVPKIPIKSEKPRYGMGNEYFDWVCPTCGKFLAYEPDIDGIPKRCKGCGQLLNKYVSAPCMFCGRYFTVSIDRSIDYICFDCEDVMTR